LIASTRVPDASLSATVNPVICSPLMAKKSSPSRVTPSTAVVNATVVSPTIARTPVASDESLIAAALAIAEAEPKAVDT
jgi:hypothetical protein